MKLYHGTNADFSAIDLSKSMPYKDFGSGFYLTTIYGQAKKFAERQGKSFGCKIIVQAYDFNEMYLHDDSLKVLIFDNPSQDWADFIFKNRNHEMTFHHSYDIVVGPVADDGVAFLLTQYQEGMITLRQLSSRLRYKKMNDQYCFGTNKAVELLRRIG